MEHPVFRLCSYGSGVTQKKQLPAAEGGCLLKSCTNAGNAQWFRVITICYRWTKLCYHNSSRSERGLWRTCIKHIYVEISPILRIEQIILTYTKPTEQYHTRVYYLCTNNERDWIGYHSTCGQVYDVRNVFPSSWKCRQLLLNLGHTPEILKLIHSLTINTITGQSRALSGHGCDPGKKETLASSCILWQWECPTSKNLRENRERKAQSRSGRRTRCGKGGRT